MKDAWKTVMLGDLCEFQRGLTYGKSDEVDASDNVVLRANNVDLASHTLDLTDLRFISDTVLVPSSKKLRKGSLLICTASGSKSHLGKIAYVDDDYGYAFGGFMGQITPVAGVHDRYLFHVLTSPAYKAYIEQLSDGVNINNLKFDDLRLFPVPLPGLREQQRLAEILDDAFDGIASVKANVAVNLLNVRDLFESRREDILSALSSEWQTAKLGDLCDIKHGYAFEGEFFSKSGEYVLLTPGNFFETGGYRDRGDKQKYFVGPIPKGFVLSEGDLLVAMTEQAAGLLGSPLLVPETNRFLHNQRLGLVVGKPGIPWLNEFFFHVFNLKRVRKEIHAGASGVKVRHTSPKKIGVVNVSYPGTLEEQGHIASRLAELSAECDQLADIYQRKIAALDELKRALHRQAFGGELTATKATEVMEAVA